MKKIRIVATWAVLLMGWVACNPGESQHDHHHSHDDVKLQLTAYNQDFEVFAEAGPFVKGKASGILAHFTYLENFKPLEKGEVTISLIIGTSGIRQKLENPTKSGIYKFKLMPEVTGIGKVIFDIKTSSGSSQVVVPNITVYANEHDAIHSAEDNTITNSNAVVFTKEQSWKVEFATALPAVGPFGEVIKTTAQVSTAQTGLVTVSSKTGGIVKVATNSLVEGKKVTNGQTLFTISGEGMADNNLSVRFTEAESNFQKAKANFERAENLFAGKIVSEKEFIAAKTDYETARAVLTNLKRNFNPKGQDVASPINGYVEHMLVSNGQFVEPGTPLVTISTINTILLNAQVQQKYAPILPKITTANIAIPGSIQQYTLEELNGKVLSFGRVANHDNFMVPVTFEATNPGNFIPGSLVEMYIKIQSFENAITIPIEALLEEQGNYFVFVQLTPELFEKREVKIGASDGIKTAITHGVSPSERVVVKGAILVKLSQASAALDPHAGHVH